MEQVTIEGVIVTPLKQIYNPRLHHFYFLRNRNIFNFGKLEINMKNNGKKKQ